MRFKGIALPAIATLLISTGSLAQVTTEATVQMGPNGLLVTLSPEGEQSIPLKSMTAWAVATEALRIEDATQQSKSIADYEQNGRIRTVIASASYCAVWDRASTEPAPLIEFFSENGDDVVTITPASSGPPMCGFCVFISNRFVDLQSMTCSIVEPTLCQYCESWPCGPPPGGWPPPELGEPPWPHPDDGDEEDSDANVANVTTRFD